MSSNITVDGKPLSSLRVVDLRDELKKRGIKASGTKSHLQELLASAILSEQKDDPKKDVSVESAKNDSTSGDENSNDSSTTENVDHNQKVASISINEEKETIKLTIRSSPRKSEPVQSVQSDTESSETSDSEGSPDIKTGSLPQDKPLQKDNEEVVVSDSIAAQNDTSLEKTGKDETVDESIESKIEVTEKNLNDISSNLENTKEPVSIEKLVDQKEPTLNATEKSKNIISSDIEGKSEKPEKEENSDKDLVKNSKPKAEVIEKIISNETKPADLSKTDVSKTREENVKSVEPQTEKPSRTSVSSRKAQIDTTKHKTSVKDKVVVEKKKESSKNEKPESTQDSNQLKRQTSLRVRLLSQSKSSEEKKDNSVPVQKKRRWGSSHANDSPMLNTGISSDKLKQLINDSVKDNVIPTKVSKPNEEDVVANKLANENPPINEEIIKEEVKKVDISFKSPEKVSTSEKDVSKEPETRCVSPAKNVESTVLFITGLVRPYTIIQLKKLLGVTGDENKFWIDKIKSKCYIAYQTIEEATNVRQNLHNLKWPQSSPKILKVEYATLEDIDRCLNPENYEDLPIKTQNKPVEKIDIDISKGKYDVILTDAKVVLKNDSREEANRSIREWDRNKLIRPVDKKDESHKRARQHSPQREKLDKPNRTSKSPEKTSRKPENEKEHKERKRSESPVKMLEDLFKKTQSTPYIYWLPLTDSQIIDKEKQRAQLEKEREMRLANRRDVNPTRREDFVRKPNFQNSSRPKIQESRRRSPSPQPFRRRRSVSYSPRRRARYSRSRSNDRNRFSPRRRR